MKGRPVEIIGIGTSDAKGIRRGAVVNLEEAVESIKKAIEEAELMAGVEVDTVHLALSGGKAVRLGDQVRDLGDARRLHDLGDAPADGGGGSPDPKGS